MKYAIALALIAMVATVSAAGWIFSNIVTVHVTEKPVPPVYTFTLTAPDTVYVNEPIEFTGSLMADSTPVVGATIDILDMSSAQVVSTATTDASGNFACEWTPTAVGSYDFKAKYDAP